MSLWSPRRSGHHRSGMRLSCANGRCGWCGNTRAIMPRRGRRLARSPPPARHDRVHGGDAAQMGAANRTRAWPARRPDQRGAGPDQGAGAEVRELRQANEIPGLRRGRLCARPRLILQWRRSTAAPSHDRVDRRSPPGLRGRADPVSRPRVAARGRSAACRRSLRQATTNTSRGVATPPACLPERGGRRSREPGSAGSGRRTSGSMARANSGGGCAGKGSRRRAARSPG